MMKKSLAVVLLALVLFLAACASPIAAAGGIVVRGDREKPVDIEQCYAGQDIVYVTESGEKYHTKDCSYLSDSCIPVSREQAIAEGKEPCSRCHPDDPDGG